MKLSTKSEYAFLALIDLAENYSKGLINNDDIAARKKLPEIFFDQILYTLKNAGFIKKQARGRWRVPPGKGSVTHIPGGNFVPDGQAARPRLLREHLLLREDPYRAK